MGGVMTRDGVVGWSRGVVKVEKWVVVVGVGRARAMPALMPRRGGLLDRGLDRA